MKTADEWKAIAREIPTDRLGLTEINKLIDLMVEERNQALFQIGLNDTPFKVQMTGIVSDGPEPIVGNVDANEAGDELK